MKQTTSTLETLLKKNEAFIHQYKKSDLITFISNENFSELSTRTRLLDCIQVFSDYFQKTVLLRYALCDDPSFLSTSHAHLNEEFNHNVSLLHDRKNKPPIWDPILESTTSWFMCKMFTLGEEE